MSHAWVKYWEVWELMDRWKVRERCKKSGGYWFGICEEIGHYFRPFAEFFLHSILLFFGFSFHLFSPRAKPHRIDICSNRLTKLLPLIKGTHTKFSLRPKLNEISPLRQFECWL